MLEKDIQSPDHWVLNDDWSDLSGRQAPPEVDFDRLSAYRIGRIKQELIKHDAAMCVLVNPITLRYAADYATYALFQSHIPTTYLFVPQEGPIVIYNVYGPPPGVDEARSGRPLSFFNGGPEMAEASRLLADDIVEYLKEIGTDNRRVAVEYVNPSLTQAMMQRGLETVDGVLISEAARLIKSEDEIACIRWAVAVADLGIQKMKEALKPGIKEVQLWALLNYANLANNGGWHDGRMLASGPRANPWCQEASERRVEAGDLVSFDTDMVGPNGYFADISRCFFCGPGQPSRRQKQLYRLAVEEIENNLKLVRPGMTMNEFRERAWPTPEEFHENAYSCILHGVGMCDEAPNIVPPFREGNFYDLTFEPGMVVCVESYMGAVGEGDGVKLEQQVLITPDGYELLSTYPYEESLLD
ncbi:MAG: Xaa-Pro peptidase family protein [Pseudomonadota bacterium]